MADLKQSNLRAGRCPLSSRGDVDIAANARVNESLEVKGTLRVGRAAHLDGSIHAHNVEVGDSALIAGHLDIDGDLLWGDRATAGSAEVRGGLLTQGKLRVHGLTAIAGIRSGADEFEAVA